MNLGWLMFKVSARLEAALSIVDLLLKVSTLLKWSKRYMGVGVALCMGCRGACGPCNAGRGIALLPSSSRLRLSTLMIVMGSCRCMNLLLLHWIGST